MRLEGRSGRPSLGTVTQLGVATKARWEQAQNENARGHQLGAFSAVRGGG